jgi:hypothetical protein
MALLLAAMVMLCGIALGYLLGLRRGGQKLRRLAKARWDEAVIERRAADVIARREPPALPSGHDGGYREGADEVPDPILGPDKIREFHKRERLYHEGSAVSHALREAAKVVEEDVENSFSALVAKFKKR